MDLLWMILLVFLVCAEAENMKEVKVELGQNITLNCSGDNANTYWYIEIYSQVRGQISRSFSHETADSQYYIYTFNTKYTAFGNRLIITNITADDCRLYYCARRINGSIHFVETIHLISETSYNDSDESKTQQHSSSIWEEDFVIHSSFVLNICFLLIIGLVGSLYCLKKKKKNCNCQMNEASPITYDRPETLEARQYEEIHLPPYRVPPPAAPSDCIYYKVQHSRSTLPGS